MHLEQLKVTNVETTTSTETPRIPRGDLGTKPSEAFFNPEMLPTYITDLKMLFLTEIQMLGPLPGHEIVEKQYVDRVSAYNNMQSVKRRYKNIADYIVCITR